MGMSHFKFRTQLVIYFFITIIFVIVSMFASLFVSFKDSYRDKENEMLENQAKQAVMNIENRLDYYRSFLNLWLEDDRFIQALENDSMVIVRTCLDALVSDFLAMNITAVDKIQIYRDGYYDQSSQEPYVVQAMDALKSSAARAEYISATRLNERNEKVFSVFIPLYEAGRRYYIEMSIYETEIYGFISGDASGNAVFIYYGNQLMSSSLREDFWHCLLGTPEKIQERSGDVNIRMGDTDGWNVWILTNDYYLNRRFYNALKNIAFQVILILGLAVGLALAISKYFNARMALVRAKIAGIENNQVRQEIIIRGNDEFQSLAQEIDHTQQRIRGLLVEIEQTNDQKRRKEMQALRAQINSHFLFNALSTLKWLSYNDSQKNTLSQAIDHLAVFLRYSISLSENTVPLSQELDHLQAYIYFQKLKSGNALNIVIDVDEVLLECPTVKLILQPLVENSIYHGRTAAMETMNIMIYSAYDATFYYLMIEDDGQGMDEKTIEAIMKKGKGISTPHTDSGYGIANIIRRLELCSPGAYLSIEGEPGKYTKITICQKRCQ